MTQKYNPKNKLHRITLFLIVFLVLLINLSQLVPVGHFSYILTPKMSEDELKIDNYYRQTEAFAHGQLHFLEDASILLNYSNPYDWELRKKLNCLTDTSYYKGKYYSYYTTLPIIFCLLPVYLITHQFFNLAILNLIILTLATFIASLLYRKIIEDYIKDVPLLLYILGFITILFGSNLFWLLLGIKYHIAVSTGILCLVSTIYTLVCMNNQKKIAFKSFLAGILTSFVVCSKPNYVMYYPLIFFIAYTIYKKYLNNKKYIVLFFIPCAIIGLCQMYYNYIRFDSIFEFGAKYQLTGFNLPKYIKFTFSRMYRCARGYLVRLPYFDIHLFPHIFITMNKDDSIYKEFFFDSYSVGLIAFPVIIFGILNVFKKEKNTFYKFLKHCFYIMFIIFIAFILINTIIAGVAETYSIDLKFTLIFLSVIFLLTRHSIHNSRIFPIIFIFLCLLNIILIIPISYAGDGYWLLKAWIKLIESS